MLKKALILTFHRANNYGAVLQAYALQEFLSSHFCEAKILDYRCSWIEKTRKIPTISELFQTPKNSLFRILQLIIYCVKNIKIEGFRKGYLHFSKKYLRSNIFESNGEADVFIVGSDQVWNYLITHDDTSYFLDFVNENKVSCSYAASIGVKCIPDEYVDEYRNAIRKIQMISVRENEGVKTLADIGINNVNVMPDPTLLVPNEQWQKLSIAPVIKEKYILVYKITKTEQLTSFAKELANKTGLPIIYVPNDLKSGIVGSLKLNVGPREWVGYIQNAEYVVTNSFHGTVFSIIFGKKFFAEVSDKVNPSTSRLRTLLSLFGLEERMINRYSDEMLGIEIQNDRIAEVLKEQQSRAQTFFEEVFKEEE